jgi:hypothetical protein
LTTVAETEAARQRDSRRAMETQPVLDIEEDSDAVGDPPAVLLLGRLLPFDIGALQEEPRASDLLLAREIDRIGDRQEPSARIIRGSKEPVVLEIPIVERIGGDLGERQARDA